MINVQSWAGMVIPVCLAAGVGIFCFQVSTGYLAKKFNAKWIYAIPPAIILSFYAWYNVSHSYGFPFFHVMAIEGRPSVGDFIPSAIWNWCLSGGYLLALPMQLGYLVMSRLFLWIEDKQQHKEIQ